MTQHEKERIEYLIEEVQDIKDNMHRVLFYLEDDKATGSKGLMSRVKKIEDDTLNNTAYVHIKAKEKDWWSFVYRALTITSLGTILTYLITRILSHIQII